MLDIIRDWYNRNFSDPQAVILALMLLVLFGLLWLFGDILAPVVVALVLAYLLEGVVATTERWGVPRTLSVTVVLLLVVTLSLLVLFVLVPILSQQLTQIVREVPGMIAKGQEQLLRLPELYPDVFTVEQINEMISNFGNEVGNFGQTILSFSLARLGTIIVITVYVVLVPFMVFFALKDKDKLMAWASYFVPKRSQLSLRVWREVDQKMANYIRGMSVIIPYVGALAVTVPIALIAYFQWGFTAKLGYLLLVYQIVQILDGNVLVPLLFSEVVNLHPLAIIVAVLFFGGLFGFWGVFFAIPLATLIQAVLNAWPRAKKKGKRRHAEVEPTGSESTS